jgi:hypothetical protein
VNPNIQAIRSLISNKFDGNKTAFADAIGVNRSQVSLIINQEGKGAGSVFYGALIAYCEREGLNFRDYIFLPENVTKLTGSEGI